VTAKIGLKETALRAQREAETAKPKERAMTTAPKTKPASKPAGALPSKAAVLRKLKATKAPSKGKPGKAARKPADSRTKSEIAHDMLLMGATRAQLSEATGWPSVNLKIAAERATKLMGKEMRIVEIDGKVQLGPALTEPSL
jgi:hypothetical protein